MPKKSAHATDRLRQQRRVGKRKEPSSPPAPTRKSRRVRKPKVLTDQVIHSLTKKSCNKSEDDFVFQLQVESACIEQEQTPTPPPKKKKSSLVTPAYSLESLFLSSKMDERSGKRYLKKLENVVTDELKEMRNGTSTKRMVDLDLYADLLMEVGNMALNRRIMKTRIKALVQSLFRASAEKHSDLFEGVLKSECRRHLRKVSYKPWKIQQTIDMHSGLNYQACDLLRTGVEDLPPNTQGLMPTGATIDNHAKLLEQSIKPPLLKLTH